MAKRFSDTDKWKKPFIRSMPTAYKLLWIYILDECDHAGIWQVDIPVAELKIGEKIELHKAIKFFDGKITQISGGEKWFIPDFIDFQYGGNLNPANRVHESVIKLLNKYSLLDSENKVLPSPLQGAKDKDKDKDKEQDKDKDKDKEPAAPRMKVLTPSTHTQCQDFYIKFQADNNNECNWNGRYGSDLKQVLTKLRGTYAKSNGREPTEAQLYDSFRYLIENLPEWYKTKTLSIINSNYDGIVNEIKNEKQTSKNSGKRAGHTDAELLAAMAKVRGGGTVANSQ